MCVSVRAMEVVRERYRMPDLDGLRSNSPGQISLKFRLVRLNLEHLRITTPSLCIGRFAASDSSICRCVITAGEPMRDDIREALVTVNVRVLSGSLPFALPVEIKS